MGSSLTLGIDCNGALQNAETLGTLVENGLDVLRGPKRILYEMIIDDT